jgi:hypothetical protein
MLGDVTPRPAVHDVPHRIGMHAVFSGQEATRHHARTVPLSDVCHLRGSQFRARRRSVLALFRGGGPPAIARGVWPIVVDAVDRLPRCPWAHVVEEGIERLSPSWTDADTAAAIARIGHGAWIRASRDHSGPSLIFRRPVGADGPMPAGHPQTRGANRLRRSNRFHAQTATRTRHSATQILATNHAALTALTLAEPTRSPLRTRWDASQHDQSPEAHSSQVEPRGHVDQRIEFAGLCQE